MSEFKVTKSQMHQNTRAQVTSTQAHKLTLDLKPKNQTIDLVPCPLTLFKIMLVLLCLVTYAPTLRADTIAYTQLSDGFWQIWVQQEGQPSRQLTHSAFDKRTPKWSPDASEIIYRSGNREVYIFSLETKKERKILDSHTWGTDPIFYRDNRHVLYVRFDSFLPDKSDLVISDLEGKERNVLNRKPGLAYSPSLSSDGGKIVYISGQGAQTHEMYVLDLMEKMETRLTNNLFLEMHPTFSPDGKKILYTSDQSGNFDIHIMEIETGKVWRLTQWEGADLSPAWSPDGSQIAFASDRNGVTQIWLMNADGGAQRVLSESNLPSQEPSFKPLPPTSSSLEGEKVGMGG
ncbi:MAG: hypothetical protein COV74_06690 [Candidatus Omnitrophica bacterium CG11_big_fil_rev_8_21_14_0_20_45_26]|uniref:Dipeptidylpeptidase IV N-terminal domain-containing protein n=1 Tax=Candidatus Abzuiibacterium crystallinum TaxID=1974748 RepID=A0A2H0LND8_9BACT|nr:MAG: hypothetical protein COV74_06690 [Candidatus Omnitrophica bacterium CG11_big_fil_rev_8_21_14_0_20_45_26]PIW64831.1 MAG: hypothetical protein COW12_04580 [Candidatus Omnitrophica bacterium CG12_big_fil_rev_8_21_14_0_65_45_16]